MNISFTRSEAKILRRAWTAERTYYDAVAARIDQAIADDMTHSELLKKVSDLEMKVFGLEIDLSDNRKDRL